MGYRDLLSGLVNQAIAETLGDLSATVTFRQVTQGPYDAVAGKATRTQTDYACKGVLTNAKQSDYIVDLADPARSINGFTQSMMKLLVPSAQLPNVDVDALDDLVVVNGVQYNIMTAKKDPSGALYTFLITAIGGRTALSGL